MGRFTRCDKCRVEEPDDGEIMFVKFIDGDYRDLCFGCNSEYNLISDESDEAKREWLCATCHRQLHVERRS